jgi:hypothetical protein
VILQKFMVRVGGLLKQEDPTVISAGAASAGKIPALNENGKIDNSMLPPTNTGTSEEDMAFSKRIDFINDNELYRGEAAPGSAESSAAWRIRKITISPDGDVTEMWAGGNSNFDKAWTDRATLVYA